MFSFSDNILADEPSLSRRDENPSRWGLEFFRQRALYISNTVGKKWP